jgi:hypothetical protein
MILHASTLLHVAISLVGILSGFIALRGMLTAQHSGEWTNLLAASINQGPIRSATVRRWFGPSALDVLAGKPGGVAPGWYGLGLWP